MKTLFAKTLFSIVILLLNTFVMAGPDLQRKADFSVLTRANTDYRFHTLNATSADGQRHYRVYIGVPEKNAPPQGFPTFYSLDGNAVLEQLTPARLHWLAQQPDAPVLVLLGYATDLRLDVVSRAFDYTPPNPQLASQTAVNGWHLGGAAWFLDVIAQQIQPAVAQLAPINAHAQTLFGHSYGGLFVLYTLFQRPQLFQHYIAADPSIWEQQGVILDDKQRFIRQHAAMPPTTLWLMRSGQANLPPRPRGQHHPDNNQDKIDRQEQQFLSARQQYINKVGRNAAEKLSAELAAQVPALSVRYDKYPDDTHGSLFTKSLQLALFGVPSEAERRNQNHKEKP